MKIPEPEVVRQNDWTDVEPLLDEELGRLPDKYRMPILLCDVAGKTQKEAARQLGWPEGTLSVRLMRGRAKLADRLRGRGMMLSGLSLSPLLAHSAASASVSTSLAASTAESATRFAAMHAATTDVVYAKVAAVAEGVLKSMLITKLKVAAAVLALAGMVAAGAGFVAARALAADPPSKASEKASSAQQDQEAMQGIWIVVGLDQSVREPSKEEVEFLKSGGFKVQIADNRIIFLLDGSEGTFSLDPTSQPKRMQWKAIQNGKMAVAPAIYSLENDNLRICTGREGDREPPTGFDIRKAKPGTFPTCWTLQRNHGNAKETKPVNGQ